MLQRIVSYIWLFTLAMALPTQGFAYVLQAENEASARLNYRANALLPLSNSDFQALFDEVKQEPQSEPITKADFSQDWLAIINANRWLNVTRYLDEGESSSNIDFPSFEPTAIALFRLYKLPKIESGLGVTSRYNSPYRISGWKETNALYVALNGQYSVIS
ncbi:hypothetical protein [Vibrio europaeus]|uniref:hypothetical protein n=1 Tax=Vibrio europaeus TaxID=300876 RepID=UPI00233EEF01|nr:hypothetical protein [Vibrio europaeus]MDC5855404.1 hypothetical protein [Vibrio europaeus]